MVFDPENKDVSADLTPPLRPTTAGSADISNSCNHHGKIDSKPESNVSVKYISDEPESIRVQSSARNHPPSKRASHLSIDIPFPEPELPSGRKSPSPTGSFTDIPPPSPISLNGDDSHSRLSRVYENGESSQPTSPKPNPEKLACPENSGKKIPNHMSSSVTASVSEPKDTVLSLENLGEQNKNEPIPVNLPDILVNNRHNMVNGLADKYDSNENIAKIINTAV